MLFNTLKYFYFLNSTTFRGKFSLVFWDMRRQDYLLSRFTDLYKIVKRAFMTA